MKRVVATLGGVVQRAPLVVVLVTLAVGGVLGYFSTLVEQDSGVEAFSPDNAEIKALETISSEFTGTGSGSIFQVVVREPGEDVIDADGLRAVLAIEEVIREEAGDRLVEDQPEQPAISSYLSPVIAGAQFTGQDPAQMAEGGNEAIDTFYTTALTQTPPEQASLLETLVSEGSDVSTSQAEAGLVLAFFSAAEGDGDEAFAHQVEIEQAIADRLGEIEADAEIRPFSVTLLQSGVENIANEIGRLFAMAAGIIVLILAVVYWMPPRGNATTGRVIRRTLADTLITLLAILLAIIITQGLGYLLVEAGLINSFNPVTQIVPILLIGLGVDYGIHLTSRYREELADQLDVDTSIQRSIGSVGISLFLATITTVIGFLTNVVSPVPALSDFGILTAVGIVMAFLLTLVFIPSMRHLMDRRGERRGSLPTDGMEASEGRILPRLIESTSVLAERFAIPTIVIALVLGGLGYLGFTSLETEFSFTDFVPDDSPTLETSEILADEFDGGFGEQTQVLITAPEGETLATPAIHNTLMRANTEVTGLEHVRVFQLGEETVASATSPSSVLTELMSSQPPAALQQAMGAAGMGPDFIADENADLTPVYQVLVEAAPEQVSSVISMEGDRVNAMVWDIPTIGGEDGAGSLREGLSSAFSEVRESGADAVPTSQNIIGEVVINSLTSSQTSSLAVTVLVATLVVMISFWFENRRPLLGVLTMLPVALVVLWTYGLMFVFGIPFGPVTATLAALAVGIGVPYTIHIARRFEEDRLRHSDLTDAIRSTTRHTGSALAGSALTTMAGFGILMTSDLTPFRQMGQLTFFAIGLAMISAIAVLPCSTSPSSAIGEGMRL